MTARKPKEPELEQKPAEGVETTPPPKQQTIRNNHHGTLQIGSNMTIAAGGSLVVDDISDLLKNATVEAWFKAGVLEVTD